MEKETKYFSKERPWLYFMVFITFLNACDSCSRDENIIKKIDQINNELNINYKK